MTMPFGKHRGCLVTDLPSDYLRWLFEQVDLHGGLLDAVTREYNLRFRSQRTQERTAARPITISIAVEHVPMAREILDLGYRAAAKAHHPDHGGDHSAMQLLNAAASSMRSQLTALETTR